MQVVGHRQALAVPSHLVEKLLVERDESRAVFGISGQWIELPERLVQSYELLTADGQVTTPALEGGGDPVVAFTNELQAAVDGVAAGKEPDLLSGQLARDALVLCHQEIKSVMTGKAVDV